ncbi:MAG: 4-alpha-glucanotransferase [Clostridiales bacterium]|nr:4-alpha-glucanotransferase [Clostridiales bacterium]
MLRSSGILLHISSLPSPGGIGTMGPEAYAFGDFLFSAKQKYWQILPMGPTGYGDSPYQCFSAFAGNPYFIDLRLLEEEGLLEKADFAGRWGGDPQRVDFSLLFERRRPVLRKAWEGFRDSGNFVDPEFLQENEGWLEDYALFMALKEHFGGCSWLQWPQELRVRDRAALARYADILQDGIGFHIFLQYQFDRQWKPLKRYLNDKGIRVIGDLPIYVALDSADVWASPENFLLDDAREPLAVAGVPPDYFSGTGQLWGNPLYDWPRMEKDGFSWWRERMKKTASLYDVVRIDHFRGFESYWAVPYGERTAVNGRWCKGPGMKWIRQLQREFPELPVIAEDLGILTAEAEKMVRDSDYPGMKVLQFAFDSPGKNPHQPHTYSENCVAYTGTHDNDTTEGWFSKASHATRYRALEALQLRPNERVSEAGIRTLMFSAANLIVIPAQDLLGLGGDCRMNTPGTLGSNWQWRLLPEQLTPEMGARLRCLTEESGRIEMENNG